jgi:hypothetical protein
MRNIPRSAGGNTLRVYTESFCLARWKQQWHKQPQRVTRFFFMICSPYRKQHLFQKSIPSLFDDEHLTLQWATADRYLTDAQIDRAIAGRLIVGYYLSVCPRVFCVDIDDHHGKGEGYLLSVYERVCACFGELPSVVVCSPRGLHTHYFLQHPVPELLLIERVRARLTRIPAEVRPTHEMGLRVPCERNLLDPHGLRPLSSSFGDAVRNAPRYHPILGGFLRRGGVRAARGPRNAA